MSIPTSTQTPSSTTHLPTLLSQELHTRSSLLPHPTWLRDFLLTVRHPPPPLPALASTANFRLLNSDFTQSLASTRPSSQGAPDPPLLPPNIADVNVQMARLLRDVPVQVLDVRDVGASKYALIEAVERVERGEEVKGREVVRSVPALADDVVVGLGSGQGAGAGSTKRSAGPHKLLLQDAAGTKVWGFELRAVPRVFVTVGAEDGGLQIGAKVLLKRGVVVRRGMAMLEPVGVVVMGGKVEEWDRKWRVGRKERLIEELKRENEGGDGDGIE